jgi:hypothetical protein
MRHAQIFSLAIWAFALGLPATALASEGQPAGQMYRIGYLGTAPPTTPPLTRTRGVFLGRLVELGYFEGKNLEILWRHSEGRRERFPGLAAELVSLKVHLSGPRCAMLTSRPERDR